MIYETPEPCKECPRLRTLADNAEFALATAERERDTLTAALKEARAKIEKLAASRSALDCRFAGPDLWESSGSHCPLDRPCDRCAADRRAEAAESALEAERARRLECEGALREIAASPCPDTTEPRPCPAHVARAALSKREEGA